MVKHLYPLLILFLSFTINLLAQEASIPTKFSQDGNLYQEANNASQVISEFKENQKCIVTNYLGNYTYKVKYKDMTGFVKDQFLFVNEQMMDLYFDHEEKQRKKAIEERKKRQEKVETIARKAQEEKELIEQKRRDSIAKIEAEAKRKLLEIRRRDSIAKAKIEQERLRIAQRKKDSIAQAIKEQNRLLVEKRRNDSIAKVKEEERKQLLIKRRNDSIAQVKAQQERLRMAQRKKDSIAKAIKEQNRILAEKRRNDSIAKADKALKLLRKRNDSIIKIKAQQKLGAEKRKKDSIAKAKQDQEKALELLRKHNDSVAKAKTELKKEIENKKKDSISKAKKAQEETLKLLRKRNDSVVKANKQAEKRKLEAFKKTNEEQLIKEEKRKYDSILIAQEQERKELFELKKMRDSIARAIEIERKELLELKKRDSIAKFNNQAQQTNRSTQEETPNKTRKKVAKQSALLDRMKFRDSCHYQINEYDRFYNITTIRTEPYSLGNNLTVELYRQNRKINVFFNYTGNLGCASYLPNQRSSVKVTLENNQTTVFYHSWDIECGEFLFKARLSNAQISALKKSPIKSILLRGTKDSKAISFIEYKEFFIDKLKCIEQ
jgi:hypothetical protein